MHIYNAPNSSPSSIGTQFNTFYWDRKSLIEEAEKMYFSPLADVRSMPMHYGKELKVYHYVPLLDDRNVSDQGIDASGVTLTGTTYQVTFPRAVVVVANAAKGGAVTAIEDNVGSTLTAVAGADDSGGTGFAEVTITGGLVGTYADLTDATAVTDLGIGAVAQVNNGAMYGSSKDVGTITGKLPHLTENGGRVNRVGFTRIERSGTLTEYGFFTEWTEDSMMFDTDSDLYSHMSRELVAGANEINEDLLQMDLLNAAGVIVYGGVAASDAEMTAEGGTPSVISYADLKRIAITLTDNRTPMYTKIIKGSRMTDTATVNAARVLYIGSELQTTVENMEDGLENAAFIPVRKYADAATLLNGEIGSIGDFRIVVVPNMMRWSGAGAAESSNPGYSATNGAYDVFPMLCVGDSSFATVGLQMSGKKGASQKFKIIVKKPGREQATTQDPYGKTGFSSIAFFYGFITLRPERIALAKTVAPE